MRSRQGLRKVRKHTKAGVRNYWVRSKDLSGSVGRLDYYKRRNADFKSRNNGEQHSYYTQYGDKYARRFHAIRGTLTPQGQTWVKNTRSALHSEIEKRRAHNPVTFSKLEKNQAKFQTFAYSSHTRAYLKTGIQHLPIGDILRIGMTPDIRDVATRQGVRQISRIGIKVIQHKLKRTR